MDTKEAIEFLERYECLDLDNINGVIDLLKRGEKYEMMWEELYTEYGICPIRKNDEEGYMSNILYKILEELEQKYFPKDIIEEVVKGITEQIKEGAEIAKEEAKTDETEVD